jgi:hypothetical protein
MSECRPCRVCGGLICGWRRTSEGGWEPLGLDLVLHVCPPKTWRAHRRRGWCRVAKRWVRRDESPAAAAPCLRTAG